MICSRCKADKSPHLFPACMLRNPERYRWPVCMKCRSDLSGTTHGDIGRAKRAIAIKQKYAKMAEASIDARKAIRNQEIDRLVEQRRARLGCN